MLKVYLKSLQLTNISFVNDILEWTAGSSDRSNRLPDCSVLGDKSSREENTALEEQVSSQCRQQEN